MELNKNILNWRPLVNTEISINVKVLKFVCRHWGMFQIVWRLLTATITQQACEK